DDRVNIADLEKATKKLNDEPLSSYQMVGSKGAVKGKYKGYNIPNDPEDISGGYLVEFESYTVRYKQEKSAYTTKKNDVLVVKSPEYASQAQMEYVSAKLQAFENAIFDPNGTDAATGLHYSAIVEMDSLVRKYLIEEFCKNYDGNSSSMYFYKPADSASPLFYAGPVWDYDSTFGSYAREDNAKSALSGSGLWIGNATTAGLWWPALYKQADFREQVQTVWKSDLKPAVEILLGKRDAMKDGSLQSLEAYAETIRDSYEMNAIRWPRPANPSSAANTGNTLDKNIAYIKKFLTERYGFLTAEWE
ncbi:MAG: CotH kinase family protein, partial [Clostridia bacterium]|nr:CotH kinase family protein [Clostridia bacterium]